MSFLCSLCKQTACLLVVLHVAGCSVLAEKYEDRVQFNEVIVSNQTSHQLSDVTLKDEDTGKYFKCSVILPKSNCSLGFSARKEQGHQASLSWLSLGKLYRKPLKGHVAKGYQLSEVGKVYVDIFPKGEMRMELR